MEETQCLSAFFLIGKKYFKNPKNIQKRVVFMLFLARRLIFSADFLGCVRDLEASCIKS